MNQTEKELDCFLTEVSQCSDCSKDENGTNTEETIFDNEFDAEDDEKDKDEKTSDDLIVCP